MENFNVINTDSKLEFDSTIIFNLTNKHSYLGDCIEDIILCIDIPVLKPTENTEYIDMIAYHIIENINLVILKNNTKIIMTQINGDYLYTFPMIYTKNYNDYHQLAIIDGKRMKMVYENTLIDLYRIMIPLFLFNNKQNNLPILKMINSNIDAIVEVKITKLDKLFKNKSKNIPLLNVTLLCNYII